MLRYLSEVVTLKLDQATCIGCGRCVEVCPHAVFSIADRKAVVCERDACMECGACARNCPVAALAVEAGVGCAQAILVGAIRGTEPCCDCGSDTKSTCCG